jgi:hypothetical protein
MKQALRVAAFVAATFSTSVVIRRWHAGRQCGIER